MFIGHYKAVKVSSEFYSEQRADLNFPTQVLYNNERYLLNRTIQVSSKTQYKNILDTAKKSNIQFDVKID